MATPAMARDVRDLGAIPKHIEEVVGREALAWHSAEWWQQQWELTGLLSSVRARLQDGGWADWLRWAEETHARSGEHQSVDPVVEDRQSVGKGKRVTVRVVIGGGGSMKKQI